jgi:ABC-type amino acid transport substrate-binding protein
MRPNHKTIGLALLAGLLFAIAGLLTGGISSAQSPNNTPTPVVGTLTPPTPVPTPAGYAAETNFSVVAYSGVQTLQQDGVLRVGTPYNARPFAWLDDTGLLVGYEVEVIRAIAEDIGVEVEFVQSTGENERRLLLSGEVDILIGEQIQTRQSYEDYSFTHTYYDNRQKVVIRQADAGTFNTLNALTDNRVGVVAGSPGEEAMNVYMAQNGVGFELTRYFSQDAALDGLEGGEISAVVGEWDDLNRAGRLGMSYLGEDVRVDLYAVAMRRQDVNLRNLLNRSLQRLANAGTLPALAAQYFPDRDSVNFSALIPRYAGLAEDTRALAEFPDDVPTPTQSVTAKIRTGQTLNVVGLDMGQGAFYFDNFLDPINRAIVDEMARRWGVPVNYIPGTTGTAADLLANGQADLAVGLQPTWANATRIDYSAPYFYVSNKILVFETSRFDTFADFRSGSWIGHFIDRPEDRDYLESLDRTYSVFTFDSSQTAREMFGSRDIDGAYADTIRLLAFMEDNRGFPWMLIGDNLGADPFRPVTLATPRNDADFHTLVNWTLSDMHYDGTLAQLWRQNYDIDTWRSYGIDATPWVPIYPGIGDFLTQRIYNN